MVLCPDGCVDLIEGPERPTLRSWKDKHMSLIVGIFEVFQHVKAINDYNINIPIAAPANKGPSKPEMFNLCFQ